MSEKISAFFVRPPRQTYYDHDLGPQIFPIFQKKQSGQMGVRIDFSIRNNRNLKINASFYRQQGTFSQKCLLYLHTHHGSRLEATSLVQPILNCGINVCLFDFSGYGNSEGETVTLGIQESEEIGLMIQALTKKFQQETFILWGRSMGAVASLIYLSRLSAKERQHIVGAIFDSPFHSLHQLTLEIGSKNIGIPQTFLRPFIYFIKRSLEERLNFEHLQLEPLVQKIKTPGIFLTSKQDQFVSFWHSQRLYDKYGGPKQLVYIDKDHNEPRKQEDLSPIFTFVEKKMATQRIKQSTDTLNLISSHFQFIDKFKGNHSEFVQIKKYFDRKRDSEETQPLTQRVQHEVLNKLTVTQSLFSARECSIGYDTPKSKFLNKTQRFSKFKHQIK